jgi:dolichol-phosphate mannosyltransferase
MKNAIDLSVIIPAHNEGENLISLLPNLRATLDKLGIAYEILVVCRVVDPLTARAAQASGARTLQQTERGYGGALIAGFKAAGGAYYLTMDADLSHPPAFILDLWANRESADVIIASRYVPGGKAIMPWSRYVLSRILNAVFSRGLSLGVGDMSSGFRLYRAAAVDPDSIRARDFEVLQEVLVNAYAEGRRVSETAFTYEPRRHGTSNARIFRFGLAYIRTFWRLWKLRNSILCADYDDRAHDSAIPLQRYWQRERFRHITELIAGEGTVLDVGCGSSRIIAALPAGSVAIDVLLRKLRYARKFNRHVVNASGFQLPIRSGSFQCVLCSQVIEHVPKTSPILDELARTLEPGGRLVLGTPDYANWQWVVTEALYGFFAPGAYADEHIDHYTRQELIDSFLGRGFVLEDTRYILKGELILAFRKKKEIA